MFKKLWRSLFIKYTLIGIILGVLFLGFFLLWSQNTSLIGFIDALTIASLLVFTIGWFMFFSNYGALTGLLYGMKTFFLGIAGKRPEKSYYETLQDREMVPKAMYHGLWAAASLYGFALLILYIVYLTT